MSTPEAAGTEQWRESALQDWTRSADPRRRWHSQEVAMTRAATEAIVQAAHVGLGMQVLDVASGTGDPALTLATVVGPDGHVTATDLVPEMLKVAEEEAQRKGLDNITFQQAGAEGLPFPDQTFDAVTCRLGIMLFSNVAQALREIYRVLKPGGYAAFVAQGPPEQNSWQSSILKVLGKYIQLPVPEPGAPHPFRFAQPGTLSLVLKEAGFQQVHEEFPTVPWPWPDSPEGYWRSRQSQGALYPRLIERVDPGQRERVFNEIIQSIGEHYDGQQVNFTARIVVASGAR